MEERKYAKHIRNRKEFQIDSAAFFVGDFYHISDRHNFSRGEDPRLVVSFIYYPKEDKNQLRLAIKGKFHIEDLRENPEKWVEKIWITIPIEKVDEIAKFLEQENPHKLSSWV